MKSHAELLEELEMEEDFLYELHLASKQNRDNEKKILKNRGKLDKQVDSTINRIEEIKEQLKEREHDKLQEVQYDTLN